MRIHLFSRNEDTKGDLIGTLDTNGIAKDWEIMEKMGVSPEDFKVQWCGDYGHHIAVTEVTAIVEIEMEVK